MNTKNPNALIYQLIFLILLFEGYCSSTGAQENVDKIDVVQEVNSLERDVNSARTNQADILSSRNFREANFYLEDAKKSLDKESALKKEIYRQVTIARQYLNSANEEVRLSQKHIDAVLTARKLAVAAGAPFFFATDFQKADDLLQKVTSELESKNAETNRASLQGLYSDLELRAIKHKNLAQARITLVQAIEDGARIYAPEKFKMAMQKYKDAIAYIEEHRHDATQIESRALAVNESASDLLHTTHDLAEAKKMPSGELTAESRSFEDQIRVQQSAVAREQETVNDKLEQARRKFTPDEAEVERLGNTLVIRLKGLKFPASKAVLNDSNLRLLGKVQRVVKEFGNSEVEVEGHTDSIG
ncbi:MAG: hypothetical protein ACXVCE_15245, partial [Bacteriovorax sp.]